MNLTVLLVEDNAADAKLIEEFLADRRACSIHLQRVDCLAAALTRLAQGEIDGILLDLGLPDSQGLETLRTLKAQAPHVPIIILSGLSDQVLAETALREGAQDYLVKGALDSKDLMRSLLHAVERNRAEEALRESEQRYKKLLEAVTDYLFTVRIENGAAAGTTHGEGCAAVTGYTPREFAADPYLWYRMVHEEDREAVLSQTARVMAGDEAGPLEHRIYHKDGSVRWIRRTIVVRRDAQGRATSYDGLISNVTERRTVEAALRASEALYHSLVESIPLNMFRKDLQGRFTFANKRFCAELGKTLSEILGRTDRDFFPPELADKYRADDHKVLSSGAIFEDTEHHQQPGGERRYVAVVKAPVLDSQKCIVGTQGMFWDVTASKWAEEQKARMRVAQAIQRKLLPTTAPQLAGCELGGASYAAEACGGDFFDYLVAQEGVDIVLGDISGHGFGSALLAAVTQACFRTLALARLDLEIEMMLAIANRLLMQDAGSENFATLVLARFDLPARALVYSSAGHPAGFHLDQAGNLKRMLPDTGPLLGIFPRGVFAKSAPIPLEAGDLVLFVSDGVLDALPTGGTRFGAERALGVVRSHLQQNAQAIADALCGAALAHHGDNLQQDDITAVVIKIG